MNRVYLIATVLLLGSSLAYFVNCSSAENRDNSDSAKSATKYEPVPQRSTIEPNTWIAPTPADSAICSTDFRNFSYGPPFAERKPIILTNGILASASQKKGDIGYELNGVYFGDVTGDDRKDAVVVLDAVTGGSSMPRVLYVFSDNSTKPQMLWTFNSGDRADGGLKTVYSQNGTLVIETYRGEVNDADCCPRYFEAKTYKWNGKTFNLVDTKSLPNSTGSASFSLPHSTCDRSQ